MAGAEAEGKGLPVVEAKSSAIQDITPEYVQTLSWPTEDFLCSLEDNIYGIEFVGFKIRTIQDDGGSHTVFEVGPEADPEDMDEEVDVQPEDEDGRKIWYKFGPDFLNFQTIGKGIEDEATLLCS